MRGQDRQDRPELKTFAAWYTELTVWTARLQSSLFTGCGTHSRKTIGTHAMGEKTMNWEQVEGKWKQYSGKVKEKWGKLTDDDLQQIAGRREQLVGRIQERYGITKEVAEKQIDEFAGALESDAKRASTSHD